MAVGVGRGVFVCVAMGKVVMVAVAARLGRPVGTAVGGLVGTAVKMAGAGVLVDTSAYAVGGDVGASAAPPK